MAHGTHCNCMMCSVGKKMGMIAHEEHGHDHKEEREHKEACPHCGDKSGTCNCG